MSFEHWDKLLYGIEQGECILFLGPDLPLVPSGGERRLPARALLSRLLAQLSGEDSRTDSGDLARVSQRFLAREDEMSLEMEVARWHRQLVGERSTLHDDLAALPFRLIVTSGHDPLIEEALRAAGKEPAVERYHYRGRNQELLPEPSGQAPVLFHLYGHAGEPPSVVLTETQLLDFLTALISRDPPLPNDLNAALTNGRLFLFLGFGLDQWYLRILLHVLKVLRQGSRAFAIETGKPDGGGSEDGAVLFYRENFKVEVHRQDVAEFVRELRGRYLPPAATPGTPAAGTPAAGTPTAGRGAANSPRVFLCHASEDKETAREVHDALKRHRALARPGVAARRRPLGRDDRVGDPGGGLFRGVEQPGTGGQEPGFKASSPMSWRSGRRGSSWERFWRFAAPRRTRNHGPRALRLKRPGAGTRARPLSRTSRSTAGSSSGGTARAARS